MVFSLEVQLGKMKNEIKEFTNDDLKSTFESAKYLKEEGIDKLEIKTHLQKAETICERKGFLSKSDAEPFYETFLKFEKIIRSEKCAKFNTFSGGVGVTLLLGGMVTPFAVLAGTARTMKKG